MSSYEKGLENERRYREKIEAGQAKREWQMERMEREAREHALQRQEVIKIIVQQKRDEYNKRSPFGKAIAKLRGKSFDKMKGKITESAERIVDAMSPERLEEFVEKGRQM